jgi:hypothetical protein
VSLTEQASVLRQCRFDSEATRAAHHGARDGLEPSPCFVPGCGSDYARRATGAPLPLALPLAD